VPSGSHAGSGGGAGLSRPRPVSERGLSGNEDRQHFDCATWVHKADQMPEDAHPLKLYYNNAEIVLQRNAPIFREGNS
jgi:hypothetical protein